MLQKEGTLVMHAPEPRLVSPPPPPPPAPPRVLVVEDDASARTALSELLRQTYEVHAAETAEAAEGLLESFRPDVVLTDVRLPGDSGLSLLPKVLDRIPEAIVIVMTAHSSISSAVEAMRTGAREFMVKPINFDALELVLQREIENRKVALEVKRLREEVIETIRDEEIWGRSAEMQTLLRAATDVAQSRATVLITGDSGTGKEVLARFLHRHSKRSEGPFVAVNCGAIPETLLEAEFFGHDKGAFTGADAQRLGRFERADGGTIFLDEIGELSPALQVKLLRVIQERQIERVGGTAPVDIDVRIIAATNQNLEELTTNGRFRDDLYYRLNVIQLHLPPLRNRRADIASLWTRFLEKAAKVEGTHVPPTSPDVFQALYKHDWPGNIRELENVAERALVLSRGMEILPVHLPPHLRAPDELSHEGLQIPGSTLEEIEKIAILKTLASVGGSTRKAAEILGISVRKVQYRLRKWRDEASLPEGQYFDDEIQEPSIRV